MLITTFQTWLPHQVSNSADDLVQYLQQQAKLPIDCHVLHQIPVDFHRAPELVMRQITELRPARIVCCGMAEARSHLTVESNGKFQSHLEFAQIDWPSLLQSTVNTSVSHDAGQFVCNYLYYQVLRHLHGQRSMTQAIFVHVPLLNSDNRDVIAEDFCRILQSFKPPI